MKMFRLLDVIYSVAITFCFSFYAHAATIDFSGQLTDIFVNDTTATPLPIYSSAQVGATNFFGSIDDSTFNGSISDGTTLTSFGCCIAAGGLSVTNDSVLTALDAQVLNSIAGSTIFTAGDLIDIIDIEGDTSTASSGRIEIGLSYIFDSTTFSDTSLSNYPFNPNDVLVDLFFIVEEDNSGVEIYNAVGTIVPIPAAAWLFCSGLLGLIGVARRKKV